MPAFMEIESATSSRASHPATTCRRRKQKFHVRLKIPRMTQRRENSRRGRLVAVPQDRRGQGSAGTDFQ